MSNILGPQSPEINKVIDSLVGDMKFVREINLNIKFDSDVELTVTKLVEADTFDKLISAFEEVKETYYLAKK
jgi:hypothetical protein